MGINPTPTNHRAFTFDGKSTREFGVYITGEGVFNAPERAVEMISIPGRDGEYALDQGHFNNIEVTYRAGIVADSTTDFAEAISNFRNWLASREGYCRLTDEYNTEEYRMAVFKNAIALEHEGLLTGEFDVTFDCKPQRFLAIGEELTEIGAWGNTETAEGEIVTIDASSDTAVKALTVDIEPVQSGIGTPSPDNVRPISGHDEVTVTVADDVDNPTVSEDYTTTLPSTTYGGTLDVVSGVLETTHNCVNLNILAKANITSIASLGNNIRFWIYISNGYMANTICNMLPTATSYGADEAGIGFLADYPTSLYVKMPTSLVGTTQDSIYNYLQQGDVEICYTRSSPTTTQLTPQQVELLLGENHIFADSGNVTVEYGHNPTLLTNPTWFPSKPLLQVWGYGDINLGNNKISINSTNIGNVIISGKKVSPNITLDLSMLNIGDSFYVRTDRHRKYVCNDTTTTSISSSAIISNTNCQTVRATHSNDFLLTVMPLEKYVNNEPVVEFIKGTAKTLTSTVVFSLTIDNNGTETTTSVTAQTALAYDGANTVSLSSTWSPSSITGLSVTYNQTIYLEVTGYSTMSALGNPIYIDLDIGEAYKTEAGEVISVNNAVEIPAELPTLPSGDTEVTYDNTITKVEVQPNYWKV